MLKKSSKVLSVATAALSVCLLTACQSGGNHSQTESSKVRTITSQSKKTARTRSSSSSQKKSMSVPSSPSSSMAVNASAKSSVPTSAATPETSKATMNSSETASVADASKVEKRMTITAKAPGVAAGQWKNVATGRISQINSDGQFADSTLVVSGIENGPGGQMILHVTDTVSVGGFALYYYPAGVSIPVQVVTVVDGKTVIQDVTDPTDTTKERIVASNGNHLQVTKEQYDSYLKDVSYRP